MPDAYPTLAKTTTSTSGTGSYVLDTADLATPHRTPKQAVVDGSLSDGDTVHYVVRDTTTNGDAIQERGEGVYTDATNTVSRVTIFDSPAGPGTPYSWPGSGTRDFILLDEPPEVSARTDRANTFTEDQTIAVSGAAASLVLSSNAGGTVWRLRANSGGFFTLNEFIAATNPFKVFEDAPDNSLVVDALGNVGVGLVAPSTDLHVQESSTDTVPTVEIEQLSTGDAATQYSITGRAYAIGIDNSDSDKFKISTAAAAGTAVLGTNDLFAISSAGVIDSIVSNSVTNSSGVPYENFASGTKMVFYQAAAPTGWTKDTTNNDAALRIVSGTGGGTGGTLALSSTSVATHTLTTGEIPSHSHPLTLITASVTSGATGAYVTDIQPTGLPTSRNTDVTGGGGSHTHGLALKYIDVIIAAKN